MIRYVGGEHWAKNGGKRAINYLSKAKINVYIHSSGSLVWNLAKKRGYVAKNTKISKYIFHKLPFYTFRIKFWCLETHPFNFERNGLFEKVLVAFGHFTVCCFEGSSFEQLLFLKNSQTENLVCYWLNFTCRSLLELSKRQMSAWRRSRA